MGVSHVWKRALLSPMHSIRDLCDGNAEIGWIPVAQAYPIGHDHPLFHPGCRCIQEVVTPVYGANIAQDLNADR